MRDVTKTYEAYQLHCPVCDETWRCVYLVISRRLGDTELVDYLRDNLPIGLPWRDERCGTCGATAQVVAPRTEPVRR